MSIQHALALQGRKDPPQAIVDAEQHLETAPHLLVRCGSLRAEGRKLVNLAKQRRFPNRSLERTWAPRHRAADVATAVTIRCNKAAGLSRNRYHTPIVTLNHIGMDGFVSQVHEERTIRRAIAEQGFDDVAARLKAVRTTATPGAEALVKLAVECVRFGLENPHLYRAMHAAQLWHAPTIDESTGRRNWTQAARRARDDVFVEFVTAVGDAQATGEVKPIAPNIAARVLTAVVDGYLFQTLDENVGPAKSLDEHLGYVTHLVQVTLEGLTP